MIVSAGMIAHRSGSSEKKQKKNMFTFLKCNAAWYYESYNKSLKG